VLTHKQFSALAGFALVAAWIAFGFGNAVLCLLGAALAYAAAAVVEGEVDLGELQGRLRGRSAADPLPPSPAVPPRRTVR
jgi:hypothetical protein